MAEKMPHKTDIIHAESLALGASAENLVDAGATIPATTGSIQIIVPSGDSMHWEPSVTPTSTLGRPITLGHPGEIPHPFIKTAKVISDDAADVTCIIVYKRGSGPQNLAAGRTEPY